MPRGRVWSIDQVGHITPRTRKIKLGEGGEGGRKGRERGEGGRGEGGREGGREGKGKERGGERREGGEGREFDYENINRENYNYYSTVTNLYAEINYANNVGNTWQSCDGEK